jgi:hypothetical protein
VKVLVNGCSHIAGTELNDIDEVARTMTWPNLINDWDSVVNISMAASSNDSICRRTILELDKNNYDFVYVQWTHFDRIELQIPFYKDQGVEHEWFCINSGNAVVESNLNGIPGLIFNIARSVYLKQFNNTWFDNFNIAQMVVLQTYLKNRNIPYQFGFVLGEEYRRVKKSSLIDVDHVVDLAWIDFCNKHRFQRMIAHYRRDAHEAYAQCITRNTQKNNDKKEKRKTYTTKKNMLLL